VTSRARQREQGEALVRGHGQVTAAFFDTGQSRAVAWGRRPRSAALVAAIADPDRGWDAIVVGEYERASAAPRSSTRRSQQHRLSYHSCTTAPDSTTLVPKAMRRAVADQVAQFKQASAARAPLACAVTGELLSWDNAHVDHAPLVFIALADEWATLAGGYSAIQLTAAADGQIGRTLAQDDAESWAAFHRTYARLRIVSRLTNLSLLRTNW